MAPGTYLNGVMFGDINLTVPCASSLGESCGCNTELVFDLFYDTVASFCYYSELQNDRYYLLGLDGYTLGVNYWNT